MEGKAIPKDDVESTCGGGSTCVEGLRAAIAEGQPNAFLGAYSAARAACVASVPAAPLHLFPLGNPALLVSFVPGSHTLAGWSETHCCCSAQ